MAVPDGSVPDTEYINADDGPESQGSPLNFDPQFIRIGIHVIRAYGWFILFGLLAVWYFVSKARAWWRKRAESLEQHGLKKYDSQTNYQQRLEAMEASRRRLQAQHDEQAARFAEEQRLREEKKRQERIDDWERHQRGEGYRSKTKPQTDDSKPPTTKDRPKKEPLRPRDYNPLMGGNSSGLRGARRFGGGGGG